MAVVEAPARAGSSVSVVVCAFTLARASHLFDALRSLADQSLPPREVIVVVDHNPSLLALVRERAPEVTALESTGPPGLAGARNTGIDAARGEIVAFLDDDAVAAPDWVARLASCYRDPCVLGTGGAVVPLFDGSAPDWLPTEFYWVVGCSYRGLPAGQAPVRNLLGCNMSFRRTALTRVGGFTPGLGRTGADRRGCEETELCIRLGSEVPGGVFLYEPQARVSHRVPHARVTPSYFLRRCHAEGLSKAEVTRRCGRLLALQSERAYVRRTLPAGVRDGLAAFAGGDRTGLARAAAILLGLGATGLGYLRGARS